MGHRLEGTWWRVLSGHCVDIGIHQGATAGFCQGPLDCHRSSGGMMQGCLQWCYVVILDWRQASEETQGVGPSNFRIQAKVPWNTKTIRAFVTKCDEYPVWKVSEITEIASLLFNQCKPAHPFIYCPQHHSHERHQYINLILLWKGLRAIFALL